MVASEDYKVTYDTNGTTGPFAITFPVRLDSSSAARDIKVYYRDSAGAETDITSLSTVTGMNVYTTSAYAAGAKIVIFRDPDLKQASAYKYGTKFPASQFESDLDYAMFCIHGVKFEADRSIKGPVTDPATLDMTLPSQESRASNYLGFNSDGEPIAIAGAAGDVTVSAFMETVLDDATAEEAKTTLEIDDRKIGQIVGGGLRYVSSDLVKLRPINYHFQTAAGVDAWVKIAAETSFTGATANYPSAGSWAYVLGDASGNITLAAATGTAAQRPTDAYFQWGELGGTGYDHTRQGYYLSATQKILGAFHKVSATAFYLIEMGNQSDEVGRNSEGSWTRTGKMQMTSEYSAVDSLAITSAAGNIFRSATQTKTRPVAFHNVLRTATIGRTLVSGSWLGPDPLAGDTASVITYRVLSYQSETINEIILFTAIGPWRA